MANRLRERDLVDLDCLAEMCRPASLLLLIGLVDARNRYRYILVATNAGLRFGIDASGELHSRRGCRLRIDLPQMRLTRKLPVGPPLLIAAHRRVALSAQLRTRRMGQRIFTFSLDTASTETVPFLTRSTRLTVAHPDSSTIPPRATITANDIRLFIFIAPLIHNLRIINSRQPLKPLSPFAGKRRFFPPSL